MPLCTRGPPVLFLKCVLSPHPLLTQVKLFQILHWPFTSFKAASPHSCPGFLKIVHYEADVWLTIKEPNCTHPLRTSPYCGSETHLSLQTGLELPNVYQWLLLLTLCVLGRRVALSAFDLEREAVVVSAPLDVVGMPGSACHGHSFWPCCGLWQSTIDCLMWLFAHRSGFLPRNQNKSSEDACESGIWPNRELINQFIGWQRVPFLKEINLWRSNREGGREEEATDAEINERNETALCKVRGNTSLTNVCVVCLCPGLPGLGFLMVPCIQKVQVII